MTCIRKLSSFPNTRERPRKPTQTADTYDVSALVPAVGPIDPNNTTITEANIGQQTIGGNTILAASNADRTYITIRNLDPTDAIAYGYVDKNLTDEGMILRAGDSADLETIDTPVYVRSLGAAAIDVRVDEGEG